MTCFRRGPQLRKTVFSLALILGIAALAYWFWASELPQSDAERGRGDPDSTVSRGANVAPEKMNAILSQAVRPQSGVGGISGRVMSKGQPVSGATVTATRAESDESDESLSELVCQCDNTCGLKLLDCGCGEASEQLKTLVAERRGEVVPIGRTVTGIDGTFELTHLDPGEIALWADSPRLGTSLTQHVAMGSSHLELELGSGTALKGKVTIDGVAAPANAWVTAIHGEQSRFFDVLTQGDGTFTIGPLPVGRYSLVAGSSGALAGHAHVKMDSPREGLVLALYSPRTITGTVELEGKPARGVEVKLNGNHHRSEAVTASDGSFSFGALRPGEYALAATKGSLRADVTVDIEKKGNPKTSVLRLVESAQLVGTVRSAKGPVLLAQVKVFSLGLEAQTKSEPGGRFELICFAGKGANLEIKAEGFVVHKQNVDLTAGERTTVDIVLSPEVTISGRVVDEDGAPISQADIGATAGPRLANVEAVDPSLEEPDPETAVWAKSDDAGMFLVKKVKAGEYQLVVSHPEHRPAESQIRAPAADILVQLTRGLSLSGLVVDEEGKPVMATVQVWVADDHRGQASHKTQSDAEGKFLNQGLPEGKQWVQAESKEGNVTQELVISARKENHVRLTLQAFMSLTGTVVDLAGHPLSDVRVYARSDANHGRSITDEFGAFEIKELKPGDYALTAYLPRYQATSDEQLIVKAGTREVKIVMKSTLFARGRVVDTEGKLVPKFEVASRPFDVPTGTFEVGVEANGDRKLTVVAPSYLPVTKRFRVEDRDIDVGEIVIGGRAVRIRAVTAATGAPVAGADIWNGPDWGNSTRQAAALTGKDGWTVLRGLPTSGAFVVANHPKYRPITVKLADTENEKVFQMEPGATLVVRVVDPEGRPVRANLVAVSAQLPEPNSVPTSKEGVARLEGMPAGQWTVHASGLGPKFNHWYRAQQSITLPESGEATLELKLTTGSIAASLSFAVLPGGWKPFHVLLLPPGKAVPTTSLEMRSDIPIALAGEAGGKPGEFKFWGLDPGSRSALVFVNQPNKGQSKFFTVPVELTAEPQQRFVFAVPATGGLIGFTEDN